MNTVSRAALGLLLGACVLPARAQTVDYSAAEQMFGEPVTTSVTGKPQRASEAPADMDIVTADEIRRSGADNIPDVLRFVAGLDVRAYGQQNAAVGIRGDNTALNPRVLVLLDGRQVYEDDYGFTVWSLIPVALSEIRQIEIIKGPSAALYGFNAVSGVINIVTYDPLRDKINDLYAEGGTQSQAYGEAVTTAQTPGKMGIRLSVKGNRSTEFTGSQGYDTREQPHSGTVALDGRFKLSPNVEADLLGSAGSVDSDYYIDLGAYLPLSDRANSLRGRVTADTRLGVLQFDVYRNENRTALTAAYAPVSFREDVTVAQASDLLKLGASNTVRIGAEVRDNTISSLASFDGRVGYTIAAGSLMWDWQIAPNLSLTNAVRVDDLSLTHHGALFLIPGQSAVFHESTIVEPSFNSGLVLKLTDYDTVRLTAARALQLPSLLDFGVAANFGSAIVVGNSSLQPSAVTNYEIDYDRSLPSIGSTLRVAAFAQTTDTTVGSPFGSGLALLPTGQVLLAARNFGNSSELGGEIGIKGSNAAGFRWNLSYALAAVHDDTPWALLASAPSVSYQAQTPTSTVIVGGGYTWNKLELDAQARWQSHFQDFTFDYAAYAIQPVTVPNYITVSARAGYHLTDHLTVSLAVEQLNQQTLMESAGVQVDRRILAGIRAQF
jgi:iron complex outermembrane receptor protein